MRRTLDLPRRTWKPPLLRFQGGRWAVPSYPFFWTCDLADRTRKPISHMHPFIYFGFIVTDVTPKGFSLGGLSGVYFEGTLTPGVDGRDFHPTPCPRASSALSAGCVLFSNAPCSCRYGPDAYFLFFISRSCFNGLSKCRFP